jgi:hypothetical protein
MKPIPFSYWLTAIFVLVVLVVLQARYQAEAPAQEKAEFLMATKKADNGSYQMDVTVLYHYKTGTCWVMLVNGVGSSLSPAPPGVCK